MILSKPVKHILSFLLSMTILVAVAPVSWAEAVLSDPNAFVHENTVIVNYTVSQAPASGIEVTLLVMKKTESTGLQPPDSIGNDPDFVFIDQKQATNGEMAFQFPINGSLASSTLRIFIGGNNGTNLVFTDIFIDENTNKGFTVSGKVRSYNPGNKTTLTLFEENGEEYEEIIPGIMGSGQITQDFSFKDVEPGTYTLKITKDAHTNYTVHNINVIDENVDLTEDDRSEVRLMTMRGGDINGDGSINDTDLTILWMDINYNRNAKQADNSMCDINGDGMINDLDLTILWLAANYNRGEIVIT